MTLLSTIAHLSNQEAKAERDDKEFPTGEYMPTLCLAIAYTIAAYKTALASTKQDRAQRFGCAMRQ